MPNIITLTGPSGCGKSTMIKYLISLKNEDFDPIIIPKFSTRKPRDSDDDEIICVKVLPSKCDLVYEQYGDRYGISYATIFEKLIQHKSPIIILNDVRTVEYLKNRFGKLVYSIFIFREKPSLEKYKTLARERNLDEESDDVIKRYQKAQSIYRIYIENIYLFDSVVINFGDIGRLSCQAEKILNILIKNKSNINRT